jgi:drug/metabolite transporter (DMT)-like permease
MFAGGTRFLAAGLGLHAVLAWTGGLRPYTQLPREARRDLWLRTGLWLGIYMVVFQWAVLLIPVSRVGLYLGAAPVWAVLIDRGLHVRRRLPLYLAALLAFTGVAVLFLPTLTDGRTNLLGELLGFSCGWIWALYGWQCRQAGRHLTGAEITAHTMWRAGLIMMIPGVFELRAGPLPLTSSVLWVQLYCVVGGGVVAYWLWNHALRCWPTSRVYLFNNLIPVSTLLWAHTLLGEPLSATLWLAMALIITGVFVGQGAWSETGSGPSTTAGADPPAR